MSPEDALQKQIEAYRRMTPDERMKIGFDLTEEAREFGPLSFRGIPNIRHRNSCLN